MVLAYTIVDNIRLNLTELNVLNINGQKIFLSNYVKIDKKCIFRYFLPFFHKILIKYTLFINFSRIKYEKLQKKIQLEFVSSSIFSNKFLNVLAKRLAYLFNNASS